MGTEWDAGSGDVVPRRPGSFGTKTPLVTEPMTEYHLDGWEPEPTRPAVILDPFGGTGTTAGVAHALGRHGISLDLSADYCRLAEWRIGESDQFKKWYEQHMADVAESLLPGGPIIDLLTLLPGIGPKTARAIVDSGIPPLRVNRKLTEVPGIGKKTIAKIRQFFIP
jgi:hypothetical protein